MDCDNAFHTKRYLDNCMTKQAPRRAASKIAIVLALYSANEGLVCFHKVKNYPRQFLGCMRNGHVVGLALASLLGKILPEAWIPVADIFCGIKECVA